MRAEGRAAVLAAPSTEPGKTYRSRVCNSRQTRSHRTKTSKDQHTIATIIINDDNRR
jgi:hypothetical protein